MSASKDHRKSDRDPLPHLVFVYGTLKSSQRNHAGLLNEEFGRVRFLATARTKEAFPLVIFTKYNIPFLLDSPGKGQQVYGEIYEADQRKIDWLDALESIPDIYSRDKITCEIVSSDVIECNNRNDDADDSSAGSSKRQSDDVTADLFTEDDDDDDVDRYKIGQEIEVWAYILKDFLPEMSELETYPSYDSNGSHNKPCCYERFISLEDTYGGLVGRKRTSEPPSKDNDL